MDEKQIYRDMINWMKDKQQSKRWAWEDSDYSDSMSQEEIDGWEEAFDAMIEEAENRIQQIEDEEAARRERWQEDKKEEERQAQAQKQDDAYHDWKRDQEREKGNDNE